jgi:hypothetical protein
VTKRPTQIDDEQRQVTELLRSFDTEPAPARLHRRVEALVAEHAGPTRRDAEPRGARLAGRASSRRPLSVSGFAAAGAVVVVVVVVVVVALATVFGGNGGSRTPSLRQAAAPTLRVATLSAPPENRANHAQLAAAVDGVPFPYWEDRFGWRSTGTRSDRIDGRTVTTVFYSNSSGRRIGYAILAGSPAPRIDGGVVLWRGGVSYRLLTVDGAAAVTWLRDGRLCVVSGRGVSSATLLRLASWSDRDATAS